jgi:hypothetical protein
MIEQIKLLILTNEQDKVYKKYSQVIAGGTVCSMTSKDGVGFVLSTDIIKVVIVSLDQLRVIQPMRYDKIIIKIPIEEKFLQEILYPMITSPQIVKVETKGV